MKSLKLSLLILGSIGILLLSACSNNEQAANSDSNSTNSTPETATKTETTTETGHSNKNQGGQVVESGPYHLEFVPETEASGTHMDFFLQRGNNHEAIPNAKVTAQVQLPDGTQKTLPLTYDAQGKHYTALLPGKASGQYQVKIISDINGKKVDGRFSFSQ